MTDAQWNCVQKAASSRPELEDIRGIIDAVTQDPNLKATVGALEAARFQAASQMSPVAALPWLHKKVVDAEGNVRHIFNLPHIPAKDFAKEEVEDALVQSVCAQQFGAGDPRAEICQRGTKNRIENFKAFNRRYADKFRAYAESALQSSSARWADIVRPSDFSDLDSVTRSHFNYGRHLQVSYAQLVDAFGPEAFSMFPMVTTEEGAAVGVLTPVSMEGRVLYAVGRFVGGSGLNAQIQWGFTHLFNQGEDAFDRWNQAVEAEVGRELYVNGLRLKDFIRQMQSNPAAPRDL